jgi:hypothetical protein
LEDGIFTIFVKDMTQRLIPLASIIIEIFYPGFLMIFLQSLTTAARRIQANRTTPEIIKILLSFIKNAS